MQHATFGGFGVTMSTTATQQTSLKDLALAILTRNHQHDKSPNIPENQCNFQGPKTGQKLHQKLRPETESHPYGLTMDEVQEEAGEGWPEIEADLKLTGAFACAMQTRRIRERGEVPSHYTEKTQCPQCGLVPIFPGVPERVDACVWCFNRVKGLPIPRLNKVKCSDCRHFQPNPIGAGGIGRCAVEAWIPDSEYLPLYPFSLRRCEEFAAHTVGERPRECT